MQSLDISQLSKCVDALSLAYESVQSTQSSEVLYELYRSACVKEFEIIQEQSGVLLRKYLSRFFAVESKAKHLTYKDVFRYASKYGILDEDACERWLVYRDRRNETVHEYGFEFAEGLLEWLPQFIIDAKELLKYLSDKTDNP